MVDLKVNKSGVFVKKIIPGKRNNTYYIELSNNDNYVVNEEMVVKYRLVQGHELTFDEIDAIDCEKDYYDAYNKALKYATTYVKTSKEVKAYLANKGYGLNICENVVYELLQNNILNDEEYKNIYVCKLISDGFGSLMITHKLFEKGLDTDFEIDYDLYYKSMNHLINVKLKTLKDNKKVRIMRYLIQRGYKTEEINHCLKGVNLE